MTRIKRFQIQRAGWGILILAFAALGAACAGGGEDAPPVALVADAAAAEVHEQAEAVDDHDAGEAEHQALEQEHADDEADHAVAADAHEEADDDHDAAHEAETDGDVRTILVVARDFTFGQEEIHVRVGETVRLVFENEGTVLHDMTAEAFIGTAQAGAADHDHETTMEDMAEMAFHVAAEAAEAGELIFTATQAGRYDLICTVPGHFELGMTAVLVVEA